jgi:RNA polymerase sigma factor (sigma-70 family)
MERTKSTSPDSQLLALADVGDMAVDQFVEPTEDADASVIGDTEPLGEAAGVDIVTASPAVSPAEAEDMITKYAEMLYRDFWPYVLKLASSFGHYGIDAEDLAQETMYKTLYKSDLSQVEDMRALLRTIVIRTGISTLRRLQYETEDGPVQRFYPLNDLDGQHAGDETADAVFDLIEYEKVREILSGLPEGQRVALALQFYVDFSETETAAAMGTSRGTVKSQRARGRAAVGSAMREIYGDYDLLHGS